MPITVRGSSDSVLDAIRDSLKGFQTDHPNAKIEIYRQNSVAVRLRIIDPDWKRLSKSERHQVVWRELENLPEEDLFHLSTILLLTPEEAKSSFANMEFENPIPSRL